MTIKEIIKEPNEILRRKCEIVTDFDEAKRIAADLIEIMKSIPVRYGVWHKWIGFAANQIGYSRRIIVLREDKDKYEILVNPVIVEKHFPFFQPESCFSLNRKRLLQHFYLLKRYLWVKVKYQDLNEQEHEKIIRGPSVIYQEIDHINGVMVSEGGFRIL